MVASASITVVGFITYLLMRSVYTYASINMQLCQYFQPIYLNINFQNIVLIDKKIKAFDSIYFSVVDLKAFQMTILVLGTRKLKMRN